jgi:hypothetical protein
MMGLFDQCLAVAAGVCLNAPATIELGSDSVWTGARIRSGTALIISTTRSDNIIYPDRRRMNKYCSKSSCVFYYKYCNHEGSRYVCTIYYNKLNDDYNRSISIEDDDASLVGGVISKLALAGGGASSLISLSKLSAKGSSAIPPYCRPNRDTSCR